MIPPNALQQLHDLNRTSPQFLKQLSNFIRREEYRNAVPNLQGEDLTWLVEYLDSVLVGITKHASSAFRESLRELRDICGVKEVLPKSCRLSDSLLKITLPSATGSVHEGTFDGSRVRIQRVRMYPKGGSQKVKDTFYRMVVVWKHLTHPNVVPLLGVTTDPLQLISVWISGVNLTEYITSRPDADRMGLSSDIAEGLNYLHSCNVIHGDLKGPNILVDTTDRARITDCGLVMATQDLDSIRSAPDEHGHGTRWIAPEILNSRGTYSKEADVFSFAMVMIEVFTGAIPFSDKPPRAAMLAIVGGERPPRPTHPTLTDGLWTMMRQCWGQEARRRPQVLQIICGLIIAWKRPIDSPLATNKRISLVAAIFFDRSAAEVVNRLSRGDVQSFVDVIDETLDSLGPRLKRKCLNALCKICGHQVLLPRSLQIPLCYDKSKDAQYRGGYADVRVGEHQGRKVAVKVLRIYLTSDLNKIASRFCKEVVTWKCLRHPNVLPLLGVTMGKKVFAMVSEWMINGNINEFIKAHKDVNRFELLEDVAQGLIYMHGEGMIHGDLKGANILIDQYRHARLADFGLLTIVLDATYPTNSSSPRGTGTTRWMSPELLDPDGFNLKDGRATKESDCYALGMVILEVLGGKVPFPQYGGMILMRKIVDGERPGRPQGPEQVWFTNDLWGTLEQCWSPQPEERPTIKAVLQCLKKDSKTWQPLPPGSNDDVKLAGSDDQLHLTGYLTSVIGHTNSQDGSQSLVLSQSQSRSMHTNQGLYQPSLESQQRFAELPMLPDSINGNRAEPVHPHNLDHPNVPTDVSIDYYLVGTPDPSGPSPPSLNPTDSMRIFRDSDLSTYTRRLVRASHLIFRKMTRRREGDGTRTQLGREREGQRERQAESVRGGSLLQSMLNRRRSTGTQARGGDPNAFATVPLPDPDSRPGWSPGHLSLHLPPQRPHHTTSLPGLLQQEHGLAYRQRMQGTKPTPYASGKISPPSSDNLDPQKREASDYKSTSTISSDVLDDSNTKSSVSNNLYTPTSASVPSLLPSTPSAPQPTPTSSPTLSKAIINLPAPTRVVRATSEYHSKALQQLSLKKGDFFYVTPEVDNQGLWYEAYNPVTGIRGLVPRAFKKSSKGNPTSRTSAFCLPKEGSIPTPPTTKTQIFYAVVQHDFVAERSNELDAKAGDPISVVAQSNREWFVAERFGRLDGPGFIPVSFVEVCVPITNQPVRDVNALIDQGVIPKVEEWKRQVRNDKATVISPGVLDDSGTKSGISNSPYMPKSTSASSSLPSTSSPPQSSYPPQPQPFDESQGLPEGILLSAEVASFHWALEEYWFRVCIVFQPFNPNGSFDLPLAKRHVLYRCYDDFYDFQIELLEHFPREAGREAENPSPRLIPDMPGPVEHVDYEITLTRKDELDKYLRSLCKLRETTAKCILESIVVRNFFAIKPGDAEMEIDPRTGGVQAIFGAEDPPDEYLWE